MLPEEVKLFEQVCRFTAQLQHCIEARWRGTGAQAPGEGDPPARLVMAKLRHCSTLRPLLASQNADPSTKASVGAERAVWVVARKLLPRYLALLL